MSAKPDIGERLREWAKNYGADGTLPDEVAVFTDAADTISSQRKTIERMRKSLETTRMQLAVNMAGKNALSNEKHLSIVNAALAKDQT